MGRKSIHEEALDRTELFVATLLHKLADAKGCEPKHLSALDVAWVQRIVLLAFREGYEFAFERPTGKTSFRDPQPTRPKEPWDD